jgi:hypothetical protein
MGLYDTVVCECDLPPEMGPPTREFETRSLFQLMERFTINRQGRLIRHGTTRENSDMQFHGDILLTHYEGDAHADFVARFTNGTLEWIATFWRKKANLNSAF